MRRVARWVLTVFAAMSLLLGIAAAVLWWRTSRAGAPVERRTVDANGRVTEAFALAMGGGVMLQRRSYLMPGYADSADFYIEGGNPRPVLFKRSFAGFHYRRDDGPGRWLWHVCLPFWAITAVLTL